MSLLQVIKNFMVMESIQLEGDVYTFSSVEVKVPITLLINLRTGRNPLTRTLICPMKEINLYA